MNNLKRNSKNANLFSSLNKQKYTNELKISKEAPRIEGRLIIRVERSWINGLHELLFDKISFRNF